MQDFDIKILSTRLMDEACIAKASGHNIRIDHIPFIKIIPVENDTLNSKIEYFAKQEILAVFTSINSIEIISARLNKIPAWKIACIHGQTAASAVAFFGAELVAIKGGNSEELAENIIAQQPSLPIVFFCGNLRMDYLPDTLTRHGITMEEVVVYNTTKAPVTVAEEYDGIIFFSPSAVDSFFQLNNAGEHTTLFAIGNTTANHIKKYTDNQVLCSNESSQLSMTERIINYYD